MMVRRVPLLLLASSLVPCTVTAAGCSEVEDEQVYLWASDSNDEPIVGADVHLLSRTAGDVLVGSTNEVGLLIVSCRDLQQDGVLGLLVCANGFFCGGFTASDLQEVAVGSQRLSLELAPGFLD
jgi:hypothetical protein